MSKPYTAQQFLDVIPGSGGILSTIVKRLGCDWKTADKFIKEHPTVAAAYAAECEGMLDMAESVLFGNIQTATNVQKIARDAKQNVFVDTADAKWVLARKGKNRGWAERQEITGKDGERLFDAAALIAAMRSGADDIGQN